MPTAIIVETSPASIDANPHRILGDYPYDEKKIDALRRSYDEVGMWPGGVVARKVGNRYQIAFGHHRVEAARRANLKTVALTLQELNDEQMLGYMGRENMEDYNANFMVMLETWEAALKFSRIAWKKSQPTDIARKLGWTINKRPGKEYKASELNDTASACADAVELISGGHITREALAGLSVRAAREICGEASKTIRQIDSSGRLTGSTAKDIAAAKKQVGKAVVQTTKDKRTMDVPNKDLRGTVAVHTYRFAKEVAKEARTPLFSVFARTVAAQIANWNNKDTVRERIEEMADSLPALEMLEDLQAVDRVVLALEHSVMRNQASIKKLTIRPAAVVKLRAVEGGLA